MGGNRSIQRQRLLAKQLVGVFKTNRSSFTLIFVARSSHMLNALKAMVRWPSSSPRGLAVPDAPDSQDAQCTSISLQVSCLVQTTRACSFLGKREQERMTTDNFDGGSSGLAQFLSGLVDWHASCESFAEPRTVWIVRR